MVFLKNGLIEHREKKAYTQKVFQSNRLLMAVKRKRRTILVRLISSADTGYFRVAKKNTRPKIQRIKPLKLEFRKYDPKLRKHVLFTEHRMK